MNKTDNKEAVYKKIYDTYNSEKGKNFITHLLRSFFPVNKSSEVLFAPVDEQGKTIKMVCCITGIELHPKDEKIAKALENSDTLFSGFVSQFSRSVDGNTIPTEAEIKANEVRAEIAGINVAIHCEKSNKYLSYVAFEQLINFYMSELLRGNKHINWISNNERSKQFIEHGKRDKIITTKKEEKVVRKVIENTGSQFSLGELDVLQELKKKMEK